MKLGAYNRIIKEMSFPNHMNKFQIMILISLNETMWMEIDELVADIVCAKISITRGFKDLDKRGYIKIARQANNFKSIKRKYCITDKGRLVVGEFFNKLNY